jgi:hypothetical protein
MSFPRRRWFIKIKILHAVPVGVFTDFSSTSEDSNLTLLRRKLDPRLQNFPLIGNSLSQSRLGEAQKEA